jgi:hypothetical protein
VEQATSRKFKYLSEASHDDDSGSTQSETEILFPSPKCTVYLGSVQSIVAVNSEGVQSPAAAPPRDRRRDPLPLLRVRDLQVIDNFLAKREFLMAE